MIDNHSKEKASQTNRLKNRARVIAESTLVKRLLHILSVLYVLLILVAVALIVFATLAYILSLLDWSKLNAQFYLTLLEFVKALAWPIVVVIGVMAFSGELKTLMRRVTEVEFKGAAARLEPSGGPQIPPEESDARYLQSELNQDYEQQIGESDEEYTERIYNKPETRLAFERTYRVIFGSQIDLLQKAASSLSSGMTVEYAQVYYRKFVELMGDDTYSFEDYMNFLTSQGLLEYDLKANSFKILPAGKLFLRYLLDQGINDPALKNY